MALSSFGQPQPQSERAPIWPVLLAALPVMVGIISSVGGLFFSDGAYGRSWNGRFLLAIAFFVGLVFPIDLLRMVGHMLGIGRRAPRPRREHGDVGVDSVRPDLWDEEIDGPRWTRPVRGVG